MKNGDEDMYVCSRVCVWVLKGMGSFYRGWFWVWDVGWRSYPCEGVGFCFGSLNIVLLHLMRHLKIPNEQYKFQSDLL